MLDNNKLGALIEELENNLINGISSDWDKMLIQIMEENILRSRGFENGCWLTRAREMKNDNAVLPYIGKDIGINPNKHPGGIDTQNRWGDMLYLSTDLDYHASMNEARVSKDKKCTVGYFCIVSPLNLFDATHSGAVADATKRYGKVDVDTALDVIVILIQKWFNAADDLPDGKVFKITNQIARLIRDSEKLDGIVYRSEKNSHIASWNVALTNENKVEWGYSDLLIPNESGCYYISCTEKSNNYENRKSFTKSLIGMSCCNEFPSQVRSVFSHSFP